MRRDTRSVWPLSIGARRTNTVPSDCKAKARIMAWQFVVDRFGRVAGVLLAIPTPGGRYAKAGGRRALSARSWLLAWVAAGLTAVAQSDITNTLYLSAGSWLIANQMDRGSNTLADVFPTLPDGTVLDLYSQTNCAGPVEYYYDASMPPDKWYDQDFNPVDPHRITFPPGAGALITVPINSALIFTGQPHVPVLPLNLACGYGTYYILSRQTNDIGTYETVTGMAPLTGAQVQRWTGSGYSVFTYSNGAWAPSTPVLNVGEAARFYLPPPLGFGLTCATNKTVACGTTWGFDPPAYTNPCGGQLETIGLSTVTNGSGCSAAITRTWALLDGCGHAFTCSQTVTLQPCLPPPPGLVSWWPGEGNANDLTGKNPGLPGASAFYGSGEVGSAFAFTFIGGASPVLVPDSPSLNLTGPLTIEAWVKLRATSHNLETILWKGNSGALATSPYAMGVDADNRLFGAVGGGGAASYATVSSLSSLLPGGWHHVAFTADGAQLRLYLDAVLVGAVAQTITPAASANSLVIGGMGVSPSLNPWDGLVDELSLYSRALSPVEIAGIYAAGTAGKCRPDTTSPTLVTNTLTLHWGLNLIANPLDHGANTLPEIFPNPDGALDGSRVIKYDCAGTYSTNWFDSRSPTGFSDWNGTPLAGTTLAPGEGALFDNESAFNLTLSYTGQPHVPVLPMARPCGNGYFYLLGCQTNDFGTYENITGLPSMEGAQVKRWNGASFDVYTFAAGTWTPSVPLVNPSEGVFIFIPTTTNAPVILQQPLDVMVAQGGSAGFDVTAAGTPPVSYQWRRNGVFIPDATDASYVLTHVQVDAAGVYDVVISDMNGVVNSAVATLSLAVAPAITSPPATVTAAAGSTATFTVVVVGSGPLGYQWSLDGVSIPSATSDTLTLTNLQPAQSGSYTVAVSNSAGTAVSPSAPLWVVTPVAISTPPQNVAAPPGATVTFTPVITGSPPLACQWWFGGSAIGGATNASLTVANLQVADAGSYSLTVTNPGGTVTGTPAVLAVVVPSAVAAVTINEVLNHAAPPGLPFVELYAPGESVAVGGWCLSDDPANPWKLRIPDRTTIPANGYLVLDLSSFSTNLPLRAEGGALSLYSPNPDGTVWWLQDRVSFGAALTGVSFGAYTTSVGARQFVAQAARTPGATNAGPGIGPVVISEIMCPPLGSSTNEDVADEFIELRNLTAAPLPLAGAGSNGSPWRLRNAVAFDFPTNTTLPAGGYLVVVGFDPATNAAALAAFRSVYGLSNPVPLIGPFQGSLDPVAGSVELYQPDAPSAAGEVGYVLVDKVEYANGAPWPDEADGTGLSLQRQPVGAYGNDPANWIAALPTPGSGYGDGAPPSLLAPPLDLTVINGSDATFNVTATGTVPVLYQWSFGGVPISGATSNSYTVRGAQTTDAGSYTVTLNNLVGATISPPAFLQVLPPTNLVAFGLNHLALGGASLVAQPGGLAVTNLGAGGQDGVVVQAGGLNGITLDFAPIDLSAPGAVFQIAATGTASGVPGASFGVTGYRNTNGTLQITADYGALGTSQVLVQVWNGATLAGSATVTGPGVVGVVQPGSAGPPRLISAQRMPGSAPGFVYQFDRVMGFTATGGSLLAGDQVRVLALNPAISPGDLAAVQITGASISLTLTGADLGPPWGFLSLLPAAGGGVTITWSGPGRLQAAAALTGPWVDLGGPPSPVLIPATATNQTYFRLLIGATADADGDALQDLLIRYYGPNPFNPTDTGLDGSGLGHHTFFVDHVAGDDRYDGLAPWIGNGHGPKQNIQSAINAAANGDTISMAQGTYPGDILVTRDLTFVPWQIVAIGLSFP